MKLFNLQMTSVPNVDDNIDLVTSYLEQGKEQIKGHIVVLPECFAFFGGKDRQQMSIAEPTSDGPIYSKLSQLAQRFGICLVAGSVPVKSNNPDKFSNTCFVFGPDGGRLAEYQKIHLFDVQVGDNTGSYRESDTAEAGNKVVVFEYQGIKVGVAICYDLRFAGLFQQLEKAGAEVVVLPSAFTQKTGAAHWHTLIGARAIENQCYFAGCNQVGVHENGRKTYGHSLIVSPWGEVLSDASTQSGLFGADIDLDKLKQIRLAMPVASHNRFQSKLT